MAVYSVMPCEFPTTFLPRELEHLAKSTFLCHAAPAPCHAKPFNSFQGLTHLQFQHVSTVSEPPGNQLQPTIRQIRRPRFL